MKKTILKKIRLQVVILLSFLTLSILPVLVFAQEKAPAQSTADRCANYQNEFQLSNGQNIIGTGSKLFCSGTEAALWVIKLLLAFSGTVAVLFLIYGGYLYLTSAGNDELAEQGKKVLINTIIGLVVIVMSTAIVTIVSSTLALNK